METFLKQVATDLFSRTQGRLSRTAVVFPNKRAGLFFNEYLAMQSDAPMWSPTYISTFTRCSVCIPKARRPWTNFTSGENYC